MFALLGQKTGKILGLFDQLESALEAFKSSKNAKKLNQARDEVESSLNSELKTVESLVTEQVKGVQGEGRAVNALTQFKGTVKEILGKEKEKISEITKLISEAKDSNVDAKKKKQVQDRIEKLETEVKQLKASLKKLD